MTVRLTDAQKIQVLNGKDLAGIMQRILRREHRIDRNKEHLWVVALNGHNRILLIELVALGSTDGVLAEPTDVFSFALQKQTAKIILVHNHPSGDVEPSEQDLIQTSRMVSVGYLVNCPVYDHIIISEKDYCSFRDAGVMHKLQETAVDLTFTESKALEKEIKLLKRLAEQREQLHAMELEQAERKALERGAHQKAVAMATQLLQRGFATSDIATLTGLPEAQVAALTATP